jgi:hypothetical protein
MRLELREHNLMVSGPYQIVRQIHQPSPPAILGDQTTWDVEVEAIDTTLSGQNERILICTTVSTPLPDHPQAVELAALLRARSLIDAQIQAMQFSLT